MAVSHYKALHYKVSQLPPSQNLTLIIVIMPNQRLQNLMNERNIQPIRLPNNISKKRSLSGPNDTRLPKQIAEDIQCTPGVTQIAMYQSDAKRKTCDFRITTKSSDAFNKYIFLYL